MMLRQSSSRNQRSKGVRVKHVLQICMLLAVCFWLIYQVKHSHDKRKEFAEQDHGLPLVQRSHEVLKLGRKDPHPRDEEKSINHDKIDDEDVEDEDISGGGEDIFEATKNDEIKIQEKELEDEELKQHRAEGEADVDKLNEMEWSQLSKETEGKHVDDDGIDEHDLDKVEEEADGDDDLPEEKDIEKEEGSEENEHDDNDGNDDDHLSEHDNSADDQEQDNDTNGRNTHEAREEHYKGDDASSAVAHVGQTILAENSEKDIVNAQQDAQEHSNPSNSTEDINGSKHDFGSEGQEQHSNVTNPKEISNEKNSAEIVDTSTANNLTTDGNNIPGVKNDTTKVTTGTVESSLQSGEGQVTESTPQQNSPVESQDDGKNSNVTVLPGQENTSHASSNITGLQNNSTTTSNTIDADGKPGDAWNATTISSYSVSERISASNLTANANTTESSTTEENDYTTEEKKETEEDSTLSTLNDDEPLRDPLITEEEDKRRESSIDLDTLPDISTEGTDSEDAAAE